MNKRQRKKALKKALSKLPLRAWIINSRYSFGYQSQEKTSIIYTVGDKMNNKEKWIQAKIEISRGKKEIAKLKKELKIKDNVIDLACAGRAQVQINGLCSTCPFYNKCSEEGINCSLKFKEWYLSIATEYFKELKEVRKK